MKIQVELLVPSVPNFIMLNDKPKFGLKQDGFKPNERNKISIADLSEDELREIGAEWIEALLARRKEILRGNPF